MVTLLRRGKILFKYQPESNFASDFLNVNDYKIWRYRIVFAWTVPFLHCDEKIAATYLEAVPTP